MQEQKKNLADREALLAAKDQRRDLKAAAAATTKVNASDAKGQSKSNTTQNKTLKTERIGTETTPNAKAKSSVGQVSGIDMGRRPSTPGAKAKAVGVPRVNQIPCSFFLQGRCVKGEECMFSHAPQETDSKQGDGQSVNAERGRSSSNEKANGAVANPRI